MTKIFSKRFFAVFLIFSAVFVFSFSAGKNIFAVTDREAELQAQLNQIEAEIKDQQGILDSKRKEAASFQRDVAILDAQIAEAKLKIKARNINIEQLSKDIGVKNQTIDDLLTKIEKGKESLAQILRKTNELDSLSIVEAMLSSEDMSAFFADLDTYSILDKSLENLFASIREAKNTTENERDILDQKKNAEIDARMAIEDEKSIIERSEAEKKQLLSVSNAQVKSYQLLIRAKQENAAKIRAALFALRDSAAIPFGQALDYANLAYQKTGVRPAFLLAILTQESNLGQNIGTCNRPGDPPEKGWKEIMKPSRDQGPYITLTSALGVNPDTMPLSCPWKGGYGGAMGPSQFIPSTWMLYANKISAMTGKNGTPNPWNPEDAFMASAIYLSELGASNGGYTAERTAALKYYAGAAWNKRANAFYGDQVITKAKNIQENMIDPLQGL